MTKAEELISQTMLKVRELPQDQLEPFLTIMAVTCLAIMRGTYGDGFADGWLKGALQDKNPPKIKAVLAQ